MMNNNKFAIVSLLAFCLFAIFAPDLPSSRDLAQNDMTPRLLTSTYDGSSNSDGGNSGENADGSEDDGDDDSEDGEDNNEGDNESDGEDSTDNENGKKSKKVDSLPAAPGNVQFTCNQSTTGEVQETCRVSMSDVDMVENVPFQVLMLPNGLKATMTVRGTGEGLPEAWGKDPSGQFFFTTGTTNNKVIKSDKPDSAETFPAEYASIQLEFDYAIDGFYMSVSSVDSDQTSSDAVRIRMYDAQGIEVPSTITPTGSLVVNQNFGYQPKKDTPSTYPGLDATLYAKALVPVKVVIVDHSVFVFKSKDATDFISSTIRPALDFALCGPPVVDEPEATPAPITPAPVPVVPAPGTPDGVSEVVTVSPPGDPGVNGDPLIMGLSGQLFKFEGRSGAWYSAVSTPTFQWNMKVQKYETCPSYSDNFISGVGFTFYDPIVGDIKRQIEVNVANPYEVNTGCGADGIQSCLGGGSLEIVLDGRKLVTGGDYKFHDGKGRILAFNTFNDCARKWYDFDVTRGSANERRLGKISPDVFKIIRGLKETMVKKNSCLQWLDQRMKNGDLFDQSGHYSTILIMTEDINLHIEYKQEHERCHAHSINVWISKVSSDLVKQDWEGIIGETKDPNFIPSGNMKSLDRAKALKHASDENYEVNGPFSNLCEGCIKRRHV